MMKHFRLVLFCSPHSDEQTNCLPLVELPVLKTLFVCTESATFSVAAADDDVAKLCSQIKSCN